MDIQIANIAEKPYLLPKVIALGDANARTLGFLAPAVYSKSANQREILVAVDKQENLLGYLLFRIVRTKHRAAITHLCVVKEHRGKGIARKLVEALIELTRTLRGISLFSRRDYESNSFWPEVGFTCIGEKPGRGKDRIPLSHYWYQHDHPTLFDQVQLDLADSSELRAAIDQNVFIRMFDDPEHALLSDWLADELSIVVTLELRNEIERDNNDQRRIQMHQYADGFDTVKGSNVEVRQLTVLLADHFPQKRSIQDRSDCRQLAHAIAARINFFVTEDRALIHRLKDSVYDLFGLRIISAPDLVLELDELMQGAAYQSQRLAGTAIQLGRMPAGEVDAFAEIFHRQSGEKKHEFRTNLEYYLSRPQEFETYTIQAPDETPLAIFIISETRGGRVLEIPLIRAIDSPLSPALESRLLFWILETSVGRGNILVKLTDSYVPASMKRALLENSFSSDNDSWIKCNVIGCHPIGHTLGLLQEYADKLGTDEEFFERLCNTLESADINDIDQLIDVEKALWPLKLSRVEIPTYLVAIRPTWAIDLFDDELANQTLFGSDPSLMLRMENVYYRSARIQTPSAPSRVLWYVTRGSYVQQIGTMAVRACSYVEETVVSSPKNIFARFSNLGVYKWQKVVEAARNDLSREILAFRFGRTETFTNPIHLHELQQITGRNSAPQSPWPISNEQFIEIYGQSMSAR